MEVRFEIEKTEIPPPDLTKRKFQPLKKIFLKDSLYFDDSVQTVWFKFSIKNRFQKDTAAALFFPRGVNKAVLYQNDSEKLTFIGKTGFAIAVVARTIPYEDKRIDLPLKAGYNTNFIIQVPRIGFRYLLTKTPILENIAHAEMKAFNQEKEVNRPGLLWSHFFTGVFFMFFVFGFIKYLVLGNDKAYLYYALLGLSNALLTLCQAEYPPLELPWFENLRGIELFNLVNGIGIFMQGLFILEVLNLKTKNPRIYHATRWFLFSQLLIAFLYTVEWVVSKQYHSVFLEINKAVQFLILLLMFGWVWYLATKRKRFYRFIFLGAITIFTAFTLLFIVSYFKLYYLLPAWLGADQRGSVNHFMQLAFVIDLCFYFTGLAYRDRQVEKEKSLFQEQLIEQLEANKVLQEKFTGELEEQVQQKTTELMEQREAFEAEKVAKLSADFNRRFSESELKALRSQMNPHFIFNVLNTIESYALQNNKDAASVMIQKFSRLTRLILENSMSPFVLFEQDWKALRLYIELEQMRYAEKFVAVYDIPEQVLEGEYYIPPMIIQPFVENAILHGLRNKLEGGGILHISAWIQDEYLIVEVEDNGIGREKAAQLKGNSLINHKPVGIKVTQDRISIFNNLNPNKKAIAEIKDLQEGTRVKIQLPQQTK